ncbi:SpaH/EbpB family LPXTG-anchored major pilin [Corynebacterium breve]|uniref:SpaH/EbpB family LPXTG-anchored major pilin n=1 Tax=Corynebacterium breve TaxID=3049799 RepID=A0ABY8VB52_9CORY|nr:SpaH/EbpB family LPXTG-anchored major pilin [Corynebacterium breve]WIM66896.1 SpaH/EbpB family LPXTG-anchored major pilin [Corynebacterium breve]
MKTTMKKPLVFAATTMIAFGALGFGAGAVEARTVVGYVSQQVAATIDVNRTVNLTIRKSKPNYYDDVAEGELPPASLAGSVFEIRRIDGIDLTKAEDWDRIRGLTIEDAATMPMGPAIRATTDAEGVARFYDLEVGLYYVVENPPVTPGQNYRKSAPFLITLPTGNLDGSTWDYDVEVQAKNGPDPCDETDPCPTPTLPPIPGIPETTDPSVPPTKPGTPSTTSTPVPGEPGQPGSPDRPGGPDSPGRPGTPPSSNVPRGPLASTGASVIGVVIAALGLIGVGLFLMRRKRAD